MIPKLKFNEVHLADFHETSRVYLALIEDQSPDTGINDDQATQDTTLPMMLKEQAWFWFIKCFTTFKNSAIIKTLTQQRSKQMFTRKEFDKLWYYVYVSDTGPGSDGNGCVGGGYTEKEAKEFVKHCTYPVYYKKRTETYEEHVAKFRILHNNDAYVDAILAKN